MPVAYGTRVAPLSAIRGARDAAICDTRRARRSMERLYIRGHRAYALLAHTARAMRFSRSDAADERIDIEGDVVVLKALQDIFRGCLHLFILAIGDALEEAETAIM